MNDVKKINKSQLVKLGGAKKKSNYQLLLSSIWKHRAFYFMALPGLLYYVVFHYIPLAGTIIAFQDYNLFNGITGSNFVGFKHFIRFFQYAEFWNIMKNTLLINFYDVIFAFPAPIILALLLNEVRSTDFKRTIQTVIYLPHFLSWVVVGGIFSTQLLSPQVGLINHLITFLGFEPVYFMISPTYARSIVIVSGIWRDMGWGTIVYLAAISNVNPSLYDAASVDGAGRLRQIFAITIPSILPVILTLFLLKMGHFLDFGFERIWVFRNGGNQNAIEIFDTFIYKYGLLDGRYSYATAIGIFKSILGMLILLTSNKISRELSENGLF